MNKLKQSINSQIEYNSSKNLFYPDSDNLFQYTEEIIRQCQKLPQINSEERSLLINYTTEKVLQELCRINQYFSFTTSDIQSLKAIYSDLFEEIQSGEILLETLSKKHYTNLKNWLQSTNPFTQDIYPKKNKILEAVVCAEYDAGFQLNMLHISPHSIHEPILDIGCGKQAALIEYFKQHEINVFGIDRFINESVNTQNVDWLDYDYGISKWGTIISNMGFSNHFNHHHMRKDGNFIGYAKKYMEILKSLKTGGSFFYAPDLPFIEQHLGKSTYQITKHSIPEVEFKTTRIKRLK